jgi:hypothetical protein
VIQTHDVVIRHLSIRPGIWPTVTGCTAKDALGSGTCRDASDITAVELRGAARVVLDHLSLSRATDDILRVADSTDVTLSWSIVANGFSSYPYCGYSAKCDTAGAPAVQVWGASTRISQHHDLYANVSARMPQLIGVSDVRDTVLYNWRDHGANIHNRHGQTRANYVGNLAIRGPESRSAARGVILGDWRGEASSPGAGPIALYLADHLGAPLTCTRWAGVGWARCAITDYLLSAPVAAPPVSPGGDVLAGAGPYRLDGTGRVVLRRNEDDARLVADVRARTGHAPRHTDPLPWPAVLTQQPYADQDRDGMADEWEREHGLMVSVADGHLDPDGDGFTYLDEFLQ